jgi:hypothetical protein
VRRFIYRTHFDGQGVQQLLEPTDSSKQNYIGFNTTEIIDFWQKFKQ